MLVGVFPYSIKLTYIPVRGRVVKFAFTKGLRVCLPLTFTVYFVFGSSLLISNIVSIVSILFQFSVVDCGLY